MTGHMTTQPMQRRDEVTRLLSLDPVIEEYEGWFQLSSNTGTTSLIQSV